MSVRVRDPLLVGRHALDAALEAIRQRGGGIVEAYPERWADWTRAAFSAESRSHVSVWMKPAGGRPASRDRSPARLPESSGDLDVG